MASRTHVTRRTVVRGALGAAGSSLLPWHAYAQGKRGGVLTVAADSEAPNWNGAIVASNGVFFVSSKVLEPLVDQAFGGNGFRPVLATSWTPAADGRSMVRIPHLGNVVLEDGVEIGANTCVDRAKFGSTVVGAGTKIDNLCQIAHNCRIGRMTVIAGLTGLAGSVQVGDGVQIGGGCGVADHRTIGNGARLAAMSGVMEDIPAGAAWGGYPAQDIRAELRVVAAVRKLPEWSRKLRRLIEDHGKAS